MLYWSKCWIVKKHHIKKIKAKLRMLRWISGNTFKNGTKLKNIPGKFMIDQYKIK